MRLAAIVAFVAALFVAAGACDDASDPSETGIQPDGTYVIVGTEFAFAPAALTIPVGEEAVIVFKNLGTVDHNLESEGLGFATGTIRIGHERTVRFTPRSTGEFELVCSIPGHTEAGMTGAIIVQ